MITYTFRIDERKLDQLKTIAKKEDRTLSQLVRIAIREFLKKREDKGVLI